MDRSAQPSFAPAGWRAIAPHLEPAAEGPLRAVFAETERALARAGSTVTVGRLAFELAVGLGAQPVDASGVGGVLELLQVGIDLADNLGDAERDAARGGPGLAERYPSVARETLECLPALIFGAAVAELHRRFPASAGVAAQRLLRALSAMAVGQALTEDGPARNALISGRQGLVLCLPAWLGLCPALSADDLPQLERWAEAYGELWQLDVTRRERGRPEDQRGFERAVAAARESWPRFSPFGAGESFSVDRLLPEVPA